MAHESVKPPIWFWVVAAIAFIWNLLGVFAYLGEAFATPEMIEAMTEEQRTMLEQRPAWATAAFAIAVWGGFFGCLLLLLRRGLAHVVLILSLGGIIIQMIYNLFIAESTVTYGPFQVVMTILIPLIALGLILLTRKGKSVGWLK